MTLINFTFVYVGLFSEVHENVLTIVTLTVVLLSIVLLTVVVLSIAEQTFVALNSVTLTI